MSTWSRLMTVQDRLVELIQQDKPSPKENHPLNPQEELLVGGLLALSLVATLLLLLTIVH